MQSEVASQLVAARRALGSGGRLDKVALGDYIGGKEEGKEEKKKQRPL